MDGNLFVFFIITVAAAEVAVDLRLSSHCMQIDKYVVDSESL